jgi:hypothetical protein
MTNAIFKIEIESIDPDAKIDDIAKDFIRVAGSAGVRVVDIEGSDAKSTKFIDAMLPKLAKQGILDGAEQTPEEMQSEIHILISKLAGNPLMEDPNPAIDQEFILRLLEEIEAQLSRVVVNRSVKVTEEWE